MLVNKIALDSYRNYKTAVAEFDKGINVIIGNNGQGKTNLLESIYYLSAAHSFRTRSDRELILFDSSHARIKADIFSQERQQVIEIILPRGGKKVIHVNGVRQKRASDISGKVMTVLFCPEDLFLVKSGPAIRRRLMDLAISQLRPKYASYLADFNKAFEHKTRILRDFGIKPSLMDMLDEFSMTMAQKSAHIIFYRAAFVKKLEEYAGAVHREVSGGAETLSMQYKTVSTVRDPLSSPSEIYTGILERQKALRQAEIDSGLCLTGAHKDDISIHINGISARSYGSQGQTRTAALSIKMAERDIFYEETGQYPILLLDDVLSELDERRQDFVLNRIKSGQVLITCCEDKRIATRTGGRILHIEKGEIN